MRPDNVTVDRVSGYNVRRSLRVPLKSEYSGSNGDCCASLWKKESSSFNGLGLYNWPLEVPRVRGASR